MPNLPIRRIGRLAGGPDAPPLDPGMTTCTSDREYAAVLGGREPAFPLHLVCYGGGTPTDGSSDLRRSLGYSPGRVVICTQGSEEFLFSPALWSQLGTEDVPLAWLYANYAGDGPVPVVAGHEEIDAALRDLAPQVRAVLAGNSNAEAGFIRHFAGPDEKYKLKSVSDMTDFVKRAGGHIRNLGGRPAFGIYHFQLLIHACWAALRMEGGDPLLKVLQDLEALVICFLGFSFVMCEEVMQPLDHWDAGEFYVYKQDLDGPPWAHLQEWIRAIECWGGVSYLDGLRKGYDTKMAELGFKAGVIGELPGGIQVP